MLSPPQVGARAPDFSLADTRGEPRRLSDFRGERSLVLVFNRGFS
ncbi:MAG TPA: redoxin domain-containing protein [Sorangium sp.]|nr:redoxin domain-containing protein [Sorangium sp.]